MTIMQKDQVSQAEENGERSSLEEQVYNRIKNAILQKELRPGEKISHAEWAERLGISRTPVRDALKHLEIEGLVIRETERIWHVYTLTIDELLLIYDARLATDGRIAYLCAQNMTPEKDAQMRQLLDEMEETRVRNNYDAFNEANRRFHLLMNDVAGNPYLVQASKHLHERTSRLYPKGMNIDHRLEKGLQENRLIAQAIFDRNPELAEEMQRKHIISYRDHLIRVIKEMIIPYTGPEF